MFFLHASTTAFVFSVVTAFTVFGAEALAVVTPYIQSLAENYLPTLKVILSEVSEALGIAFDWASKHKEVLTAIAIAIGVVTTAIGLYNAVAAIKATMAALEVTTVWALVAAYAAQGAAMLVAIAPYVAIVAAIAAVIAIIVLCIKHWDDIKAKVSEVWSNIKSKTSEAVSNVKGKFDDLKSSAVSKVNSMKQSVVGKFSEIKSSITEKINGARDTVKGAIDKIKSFFNFSWSLPKLKLPHIKISGEFSLIPPSTPSFSIDWYAQGGVFDKPTLFNYGGGIGGLGEAGAEAIVPLENNTQWLDKIADKLASKQGSIPIILQVDGKTFAQTSIDSINALTKQKGKLELNLI